LTVSHSDLLNPMSRFESDFAPKSPALIRKTPVVEDLNSLPPVTLELVSQSNGEDLWDRLVRQHHYLDSRRLMGHRLKYLA
jgi:hypothetical protein